MHLRGYRGLQEVTRGDRGLLAIRGGVTRGYIYKRLREDTGSYKGLLEVTGGYKRLQEVRRGYRGLQGVTRSWRGYKGLHEVTWDLKGVTGGYKG